MPHYHIPLQSGSNKILRAMRRRYDKAYKNRIKKIKETNPDTCIGVDVIVGFPMNQMLISWRHIIFFNRIRYFLSTCVFYSERSETDAKKINEKVQKKCKV